MYRRTVYSQGPLSRRAKPPETRLELLYFEDLPLGVEWRTRRRTISDAEVALFSGLACDFSPLHSDPDYARGTHFGGPIVPAALLASTAIGLGSIDAPMPATVGLVGMSWKFLKPVRAGEAISARWRIGRKRSVENPSWGLGVWQVEVMNQAGDIVAEGEVHRLVARRDAPASSAEEAAAVTTRRRRSRSRSRRPLSAADGAPTVQQALAEPVPDPAPDDSPSPAKRSRSRRRRGRSTSGGDANGGSGSSQPAGAEPPPAVAPVTAPVTPSTSANGAISRVLRRLRGS